MLELLHSFAPRLYSRVLPCAFKAGNYRHISVPPTIARTVESSRIARSACALAGFCAGVAIAAGLIGAREQKQLWPP
jgi:hypothetical protein